MKFVYPAPGARVRTVGNAPSLTRAVVGLDGTEASFIRPASLFLDRSLLCYVIRYYFNCSIVLC